MMIRIRTTLRRAALLIALAFALGLAGPIACQSDGPFEEAGEEIDDAVGDAGDGIEDAADDIGDGIEDAADELD